MSDRQTLLLALVVIYLVECLFWVRRGAVVLRTWLGRRWAFVTESEFARNDRGGLFWAWPLPPWGDVHVCRAQPISFGPAGVLFFTAETPNAAARALHSGQFIRWEDFKSVGADGKKLRVNDSVVWTGDTPHTPARLAGWFGQMARLKPEVRIPKLEAAIDSHFDGAEFDRRRTALKERLGRLDLLCEIFFVYLFLAVPTVIARFGWLPALWILLPLLFVQSGVIAWLFARHHRALFPHATEDRFKYTLIYGLAPASTVRARDPIMRGALEEFHPLAAAASLLSKPQFDVVARAAGRDLKFPRLPECPNPDPAAIETERWYREHCLAALQRTARKAGLDPTTWTHPPVRSEPVNTQYCPRCEAQFTREARVCQECGGRSLLPLEAPRS